MRFEGQKGEHFFRSTLVQTLFYGVFSAWVIWAQQRPRGERTAVFDWRTAAWSIELPVLRTLFSLISSRSTLQPLDLVPLVDSACRALNRVDREQFFAKFEEGLAVQYFYEPFLEAFDPELRKQLGVWYTPREIVQYQVARVDAVVREELEIEDGLADRNVVVLDPCCGTGTYLVEVLKRIADTLKAKGGDALLANDLKRAAQERIFGFEILPAPFVVAHLQIELLLAHLGAPLGGEGERVGVYLTNALTGWEPPKGPKQRLLFEDLEKEREAADHVKRDQPILVILGNPPYNAFAGVSTEGEHGAVDVYKKGLSSEWGIRKYNLDDLYVRFFRLAERRIAEVTGKGIVSFISNYSYLGDPSFVVLRQRFTREFDSMWFDCLNGDSRETGKPTPEGEPDPSVFSTERNREGIRVGTAVCVLSRRASPRGEPEVRFRRFWGVSKRLDLLASLTEPDRASHYDRAQPSRENRFSFRPTAARSAYQSWPTLPELAGATPISGLQEMRRGALMGIDCASLAERVGGYLDRSRPWTTISGTIGGLAVPAGMFEPEAARSRIIDREAFDAKRLRRYALYPFDHRWCYWSDVPGLWNRARPELVAQGWPGNAFLITRMNAERPHENVPVTFTRALPDYHLLRPNVIAIPVRLHSGAPGPPGSGQVALSLLPKGAERLATTANLGARAERYMSQIGCRRAATDAAAADLVWMHALAVAHSPAYLAENSGGIKADWPRIPLPATRELLEASAALGRQVADLLDPETEVTCVTSGSLRAELRAIAAIASASGRTLDLAAGDLALTAGWGHAGMGGITMPGKGRIVERPYTTNEREAIAEGAAALGLAPEQALALLGATTCNVFLNEKAFWRCVPANVWAYTIGGYQVLKKWLSYRERDLLGRDLKDDEARYFTEVARRIAAILLLSPALDENYRAVKADTFDWSSAKTPGT